MLGPVLGALVLVVADWRAIFWLNALLGALLAVGRRRDRRRQRPPAPAGRRGARSVVAAVAGWLALAAPDALVTSVSLGLPFVPFGDATSRLATPIGVVAAVFLLAALAVGGAGRVAAAPARRPARCRCCSAGPWAASCSPSRPPNRPPRSWGRSATPCYPWPPCSPCCMPCTTAAAPSPLVPRGLVRGAAGLGPRGLAARRGGARGGRGRRAAARARRRRGEPDRGGPGAGPLPPRRAGRRARGGLGAAPARQRRRRRRRTGPDHGRSRRHEHLGPGVARPPLGHRGARPGRPRHRARPRPGQRRRAGGGDERHAAARHPRSSSWRGWWAWWWASRSSPPSVCTSTTALVATLPDPTDTEALKGAAVVQVAWVFRGAAVAAGLGALAALALGLRRRTGEHATTFGL